jgi:hypothetical protein
VQTFLGLTQASGTTLRDERSCDAVLRVTVRQTPERSQRLLAVCRGAGESAVATHTFLQQVCPHTAFILSHLLVTTTILLPQPSSHCHRRQVQVAVAGGRDRVRLMRSWRRRERILRGAAIAVGVGGVMVGVVILKRYCRLCQPFLVVVSKN